MYELEEIVPQYGDYLLRVAYLYTKDQMLAEDVMQDVFLKFYKTQGQFDGRASLKTYLVKMTVNRCHDVLRKKQRKQESFFAKIFGQVDKRSPEQELLVSEQYGEVTAALWQLSLAYREAIILFYYEEMTSVEIAELIGVGESTVRMRLKRAREQLRTILQGYEWEALQ